MAYYLSMDGVDDYITTPSLTYDEIVMDFSSNPTGYYKQYFSTSASNLYFLRDEGYELWTYEATIKYNGSDPVLITGLFTLPNDTQGVVSIKKDSGTGTINIFANQSGGTCMRGNLYRVTVKLAGTTVADYDMSLGNVNDISGNSKHATLNGGTWVSTGGGGTNYPVSLSDSVTISETRTKQIGKKPSDSLTLSDAISKLSGRLRTDSVTLSETFSKKKFVVLIDTQTLSDTEYDSTNKAFTDALTLSDSIANMKGKAVSLSDSLVITDTIRKAIAQIKADSVTLADADSETIIKAYNDSLTLSDSITTIKGKAVILADSLNVTDSIKKAIGKLEADNLTLSDALTKRISVTVKLFDVLVITDSVQTSLPNAPNLIGRIQLTASRSLHIYLLGSRNTEIPLQASRNLFINLKGALPVAERNQNFEMFAGDTENVVVTVTEGGSPINLSGATIRWVMKRAGSVTPLISKTSPAGITITDTAGGKFTISLMPADTEDQRGDYYHEAEVTDASGNVSTVMTGRAAISVSNV